MHSILFWFVFNVKVSLYKTVFITVSIMEKMSAFKHIAAVHIEWLRAYAYGLDVKDKTKRVQYLLSLFSVITAVWLFQVSSFISTLMCYEV